MQRKNFHEGIPPLVSRLKTYVKFSFRRKCCSFLLSVFIFALLFANVQAEAPPFFLCNETFREQKSSATYYFSLAESNSAHTYFLFPNDRESLGRSDIF